MKAGIDKDALVDLVRQGTDTIWIGVFGSAAYSGQDFQKGSDIDVLAVDQHKTQFSYRKLGDRDVEINRYSIRKIQEIAEHPEWFGTNWVWEFGKIKGAEKLYGDWQAPQITRKAKTTALIGCLGKIVMRRKKLTEGRFAQGDGCHELTALGLLMSDDWPYRYREEVSPKDMGTFDFSGFAGDLREHLPQILFYPDHRLGAQWLSDHLHLGLSIPTDGTIL